MKEENKRPIVDKRLSISSLLTATRLGQEVDVTNSLAKHGLPKNGKKTTDYFVLQTAVKKNHKGIVKVLLEAGCRRNGTNNDCGLTPLAIAIKNENQEIATLLLEKGANFDTCKSNDLTVLHLAAEQKSFKMIQLLFQYNVDVNSIRCNKTAFQIFFDSSLPYNQLDDEKNVEIFKLFLSNGSSIRLNHEWTVLHFVVTSKKTDVIKMVLQATTDINQCTDQGNTSLHHLLISSPLVENELVDIVQSFVLKGAKVDIPNSNKDTVCHLAAKKKYLKVLQVFTQTQWDPNHCDSEGNTVLHTILENSSGLCTDDLYYQIVTSILNMESLKFVENNLGKFPIHVAIENNQRRIVKDMLLKPGISVNITDKRLNNYTILHLYLKKMSDNHVKPDDLDVEIVRRLMSLGAQADLVDDNERKITPMHFALMLKSKTILQLLLENFNFKKFDAEQKRSILHYLIYNMYNFSEVEELETVKIAELCINSGANVNVRDESLKTPLPSAVLRRQKHMVKLLLENGAELDEFDGKLIVDSMMGHEFAQLTYCPASMGPFNMIMEIIDIPQDIPKDIEILEMLASKGFCLETTSPQGFTIFHYAAARNYTEMLLKLLPYCRNPNVRDLNENTVLHAVLTSYLNKDDDEEKKLLEVVSALLSKEALVSTVNDKGEMPLHLAAKTKHFEICQILLQHGAEATALDNNGNSVLHHLSMLSFETRANAEADLMTLFIEQGCDINAKNAEGTTPLLMAAQFGCTTITRILLQHRAKMDCAVDENASTPLHVAAVFNHAGVTEELIKFGIDVNTTRNDGATALHLSACHREPRVSKILLENGADPEMKDIDGRTALHWACWYNSFENVTELLKYGANINAEDNYEVIPLIMTQPFTDAWAKVYYHAIKLQAASIKISKHVAKCMAKYEQDHPNNPAVCIANEFFNAASEEVSRMKKIPVDVDFNLSDVLRMSPRNLCRFSNNQDFQDFLFSHEFEEKFPHYGNLLRACYRKNVVRSGLLALAKDAFGKIVGFTMEDSCSEKIFDDLSDHDLRQLDKAAILPIRKRKRLFQDANAVSAPKRRRRASF